VHGDIVHQFSEVVGASYKIAFAIHLNQHTDLASCVDVAGDGTFTGDTGSFLLSDGGAALTKNDDGLFHIALGLGQGLLTVHHGRSGAFAELFHLISRNIHS
jgi:hypothetical protein